MIALLAPRHAWKLRGPFAFLFGGDLQTFHRCTPHPAAALSSWARTVCDSSGSDGKPKNEEDEKDDPSNTSGGGAVEEADKRARPSSEEKASSEAKESTEAGDEHSSSEDSGSSEDGSSSQGGNGHDKGGSGSSRGRRRPHWGNDWRKRVFAGGIAGGSEAFGGQFPGSGSGSQSGNAALVLTTFQPENYPKVLAVPMTRRPLFPNMLVPVSIKDSKLVEQIIEQKRIGRPYVGAFLTKETAAGAAKNLKGESEDSESIEKPEMYKFGTLAQVHTVMGLGDSVQLLLQGHRRLMVTQQAEENPNEVYVEYLKDQPFDFDDVIKATQMEIVSTIKDLVTINQLYKEQVQVYAQQSGALNSPSNLADFAAAITSADEPALQAILECLDVPKRLNMALLLLKKELELSRLQANIGKQIEDKVQGEHRKYMLQEQLKTIKKELGLEKDDKSALAGKFQERLKELRGGCSEQVLKVIEEELDKLQALEPTSSEFNVTRNYLDWLTSIPWGKHSEENYNVLHAQKVLDRDHYGLEDVKERILEFIAVSRLRGTAQGKIICLSGPPGTGKTSIGRSIASALNRKFYRFSVGGLGDVAEIKGHRRTYIGAMPGKMVQCLKSVQTANPLVLIDEIDKLGRGHAGDPASALLELLDPEQNSSFLDHYLDVPVDLSKVLFVCTANVVEHIPGPLLDRMEVIRLVGYITAEKMHIARDYLEPAARKAAGVRPEQAELMYPALHELIETYCREAGVRNLQKHIDKIYRKVALKLVREELAQQADLTSGDPYSVELWNTIGNSPSSTPLRESDPPQHYSHTLWDVISRGLKAAPPRAPRKKLVIDKGDLSEYVGNPIFQNEKLYEETPVGVVMGLAWTAMGGSTLYVETSLIEEGEGKGGITTTGQLGDVMRESTTIAHTLSRRLLREREPENKFFQNARLHLHVPAGATPKDGPSAGCTMITSMLSLAMNRPVRPDLAMTGEVTLTGRVLPIGGVKEKTIAARRSGVTTVIFPFANKRDFEELPAHVKEGLDVHFVTHYDEIFKLALDYEASHSSGSAESR